MKIIKKNFDEKGLTIHTKIIISIKHKFEQKLCGMIANAIYKWFHTWPRPVSPKQGQSMVFCFIIITLYQELQSRGSNLFQIHIFSFKS